MGEESGLAPDAAPPPSPHYKLALRVCVDPTFLDAATPAETSQFSRVNWCDIFPTCCQWRQRLGNFANDGLSQRGRYPGDGSYPVGSRGEDPIRGLVEESPKLILIL